MMLFKAVLPIMLLSLCTPTPAMVIDEEMTVPFVQFDIDAHGRCSPDEWHFITEKINESSVLQMDSLRASAEPRRLQSATRYCDFNGKGKCMIGFGGNNSGGGNNSNGGSNTKTGSDTPEITNNTTIATNTTSNNSTRVRYLRQAQTASSVDHVTTAATKLKQQDDNAKPAGGDVEAKPDDECQNQITRTESILKELMPSLSTSCQSVIGAPHSYNCEGLH